VKPPELLVLLLVLHVVLLRVVPVQLRLWLLLLGRASAGTGPCWSEPCLPRLGGCQLAGR
jgi:hypothetical protein